MMTIVNQLAIPVLLVLLTYFATREVERAKWKREYRARWDTRQLEAVAEYAKATKKMLTLAWDISKSNGLGTSVSPKTFAEAGHLLDDAETTRGERFEQVLLLASEQTRQTARQWHGFAWEFARIAKGTVQTSQADFMSLREKSFKARDQFYMSARADLRIDKQKYRIDLGTLTFYPTLVDGQQ